MLDQDRDDKTRTDIRTEVASTESVHILHAVHILSGKDVFVRCGPPFRTWADMRREAIERIDKMLSEND
jgi:hypothetical protein